MIDSALGSHCTSGRPVGVFFALACAVSYGVSDFAAGLASRRLSSGPVTAVVQFFGLLTAAFSIFLFPGSGPTAAALLWGTASGSGSAVGTLALYRGLAVGRMSVVATVSAVITAVLPVAAGIVLGERLTLAAVIGIVIAIPAIALVSWQPDPDQTTGPRAGLVEGILAGLGFSFVFIALHQAGAASGSWPVVPGQAVSVAIALPFARGARRTGSAIRATLPVMMLAGFLSGSANLLFLASTAFSQLAVVAVVASLYPAVTVLLARFILAEHWSRAQAVGLITAAAAIVLVGLG